MYSAIVLAVATAFVLTIWLCWFALNLALDTSRATRAENRRYVRTNVVFGSVLVTVLALTMLMLRLNGVM